ncbi:MAG: T9SS type A sorting domain-containing protein [Bacteroidetes bacterium]|nr:T9SS type A sorting domain-containing protein [Bacteroidota bacterium]MCZ2102410.1 T9SS type A sorting domain-containing protein [Chitinophagales bacterium]
MKLHYFLLALLFALIAQSENTVYAQKNTRSPKSSVRLPNYYELLREYEREMKEAGVKSGDDESREKDHDDWKHIERWKWFWSSRVDERGNFPNAAILMREWEKSGTYNARLKMDGVLGANALAQWKQLGPSVIPIDGGTGRLNCVRISDKSLNTIWVGTAAGGAWKSTDGGTNWSPMTDYLPALSVSDIAIHPNSVNTLFIATGDADAAGGYVHYSAGILRSDDGGKTWNPTGLSYRQNQRYSISRLLISPATPNLMLAATNGGIMLSSDAGATWNNVQSGNFRDMEYQPNNPLTVYASTGSTVYKSTNAGKNWTALTSSGITGTINLKLAVTQANPAYVYALGANNQRGFAGVWLSSDAGATWKKQSSSPNLLDWNVKGTGAGGQGEYDLAIAVSRTSATAISVGGINIWRSVNAGIGWECVAHWAAAGGKPYVHADIHDLIYTPDGKLYAGTDGGLFVSQDGGTSWIDLSKGLCITQFYRIGVGSTNANIVIGGSQDNGTSGYNGSKWRQVLGGDGMNCLVDYKNANIAYGALYYGDIYKTTDNWESSHPFVNPDITKENGAWVAPYQLHPTNTNTAFAGFRNVWRTTTSGGSWEKISNFNQGSLTILEVAKSNPDYIYAGNSNGIKYTTDGGTAWNSLKLPASVPSAGSIEIDPKVPNRIWIGVGGFGSLKVLETNDFGTNWTDISAGLPAIPVNCLAYSKNSPDRIYAGTDIGVYYRDTLTKTWIAYSDGMPATIVCDLEIHYGTGKLYAGTFGRGIWVGNLANCNTKIDLAVTQKGKLTFCEGDSVTLTAQGGYSSYLWSNGAATPSITIKTSGEYSVTALTSSGCPAISAGFTVTAKPQSMPNISTNKPKYTLCGAADSMQLTASIGFTSYRWNNGDTTRRITIRKPGKYYVAVSKPEYCDGVSDTVEVKIMEPIQATITRNDNQLTANPVGIMYEWYIDGQKIPGNVGRTYTAKETAGKIRVAVTDSNGCRSLSEEIILAMEESVFSEDLDITPNPTTGDIFISLDLATSGSVFVELIATDGKIARSETVTVQDAKLNMKLTTNNLPAGVYYLRVTSNGREWRQQVIKQ